MTNKINVAIVTLNRQSLLADCLNSIKKQPKIIIGSLVVIDNNENASEKIKTIVSKYDGKYYYEPERGEAFARNKALKVVPKGIFSFIDDDCVAKKNWLKIISDSFNSNSKIDILVGRSENLLKDNIYSCVYQCYYIRWLLENFKDISTPQKLYKNNNVFDTKNIAFKRKSLQGFSFDTDILFHSINVDVVAGAKLIKQKEAYYEPNMVVYHKNPDSLKKLFMKNFFQGVGEQLIMERKKIEMRKPYLKRSIFVWLKQCLVEIRQLNILQKLFFLPLLFIYPIPYKIGRICYRNKLFNFE